MSDTFTTLLGLRLQATGGNENTWGALLNQDTVQPLEDAIANTNTHSVTGGAVDLSADPLLEQVHVFSGVLASDLTVTIPNLSKRMLVFNNTTGAFFMLLKTSSGTAVCIPQGTIKDIYCDGSNNIYRGDRNDVGELKFFGTTSVPPGYFECDGSAKSRTLALDLFGAIGTTFGVGNGSTTFNLPDGYTSGQFLRSRTASVAVGTAQSSTNLAHIHTASSPATSSGTVTVNAAGSHNHTGNTSGQSVDHNHSGTTNNVAAHNHGGVTGGESATHNHVVFPGVTNTIVGTVGGNPAGGSGGNIWFGSTTNTTSNANTTDHTHSITADGAHNHPFSTGGTSIDHSHIIATQADHTHTASTSIATTVTTTIASTGDTESRPTNISALLCIRY